MLRAGKILIRWDSHLALITEPLILHRQNLLLFFLPSAKRRTGKHCFGSDMQRAIKLKVQFTGRKTGNITKYILFQGRFKQQPITKNHYMLITVTYSVQLYEADVKRIKNQLNSNPSLAAFKNMKEYIKDRVEGAVILELQKDYDENLDIRCEPK